MTINQFFIKNLMYFSSQEIRPGLDKGSSMLKIALVLIAGLLHVGCASDGDTLKPRDLVAFKAVVDVKPVWKSKIDSTSKEAVSFRPYIDDDSVYFAGTNGQLKKVNRKSGKDIWRVEFDEQLLAGVSGNNKYVYLTSFEGHLFSISKVDGSVFWKKKFSSELLRPPAATSEVLVARTLDGNVYALEVEDGAERWRFEVPVPILTLHGYGRPLIVPGGVLLGLDNGYLLALSLEDGRTIWQTQISRAEGRSEIDRLVDVDGDVVIDQQYIYATSYSGRLVQVEPGKGSIIWSRPMNSTETVAVDGAHIYVTEPDGYIWALNKNTGSSMWKSEKLEGRRLTGPLAFDDYVLVGDLKGYLHILSKSDGQTLGRYRIDNEPIVSTPVLRDKTVYTLSRGGVLRAIELNKITGALN